MIFQHTWQQVLDGTKTQTRRLVKEGETSPLSWSLLNLWIRKAVFYRNCIKWYVGRTYAVQPGRGKKAVGRIRITAIRRERLQDISEDDARAEGCYQDDALSDLNNRFVFRELWTTIHTASGTTWADNPEVWCLSFCLAEVKHG